MSHALISIIAVISGAWVIGACAVAYYGSVRGYPYLPLLVCSLFLPWPLVLLAIVVGEGPRHVRRGSR